MREGIRLVSAAILLGMAAFFVACNVNLWRSETPVVVTINEASDVPASTLLSGAGADACAAAVKSVTVNPFDAESCAVANHDGVIPIGCTLTFTATPKNATGGDVPAAIHGTKAAWTVKTGADRVALSDYAGNEFNQHVKGLSAGSVSIEVSVCATSGPQQRTGTWSGRVE